MHGLSSILQLVKLVFLLHLLTETDPEDLVAMGTNWGGNTGHSRNSRGGVGSGGGGSVMGLSNGSGGQISAASNGPLMPPQARKVLNRINQTNGFRQNSREEPRYSDPIVGASPSFQQRVAELASLEAETLRWEKARKVKKKPTAS